jgi:hypothetical protein
VKIPPRNPGRTPTPSAGCAQPASRSLTGCCSPDHCTCAWSWMGTSPITTGIGLAGHGTCDHRTATTPPWLRPLTLRWRESGGGGPNRRTDHKVPTDSKDHHRRPRNRISKPPTGLWNPSLPLGLADRPCSSICPGRSPHPLALPTTAARRKD